MSALMHPLPGMNRLCKVWDAGAGAARSNLEHATQVALTFWMQTLDGVDFRHIPDWREQLTVLATGATVCRIEQAIDDEVTWWLGNRTEAVTIVADSDPGPLTVGRLINRITMNLLVTMQWPEEDGDECPGLREFQAFGRDYDALITGLNAGTARQPRLRSYPALPIPQPQQINLAIDPTRN